MSRHVIATARWEPMPGDPAATERGRWVAESFAIGVLGILPAGRGEVDRASEQLREILADSGLAADVVGPVTNNTVIAWSPEDSADVDLVAAEAADAAELDEREARQHQTITSGATPEDTTGAGAVQHPSTDNPQRAEIIASLRLLCDYLDAHPTLPINLHGVQLMYPIGAYIIGDYPAEMAELERIRGVLGDDLAAEPDYRTGGHPSATVRTGLAEMRWYVIPPEGDPDVDLPTCGPIPPRTGASWSMTPTRRALLGRVSTGDIYAEAGQAHNRVTGQKVSGRIVEAIAAGWVAEGSQVSAGRRTYTLTPAGREAAAAWDQARGGAR